MNSVCRDIFTAIHKGQWLSIEYKNKDGNVTRYWIAIRDVKDCIKTGSLRNSGADDRPFIIAVGMDIPVDLEHEYAAIIDMYNKESVSAPVRAFFGDYVKRAGRRKALPLALVNKKVNLDQLLAINDAMKYPLTYVQGPPGTGKTNTIINTIMTAFFNEQTVLFTSYNNHPIDGVFKALQGLKTYLACDAVSEEVLLSYHYRCHEKIIDFNNRKYYFLEQFLKEYKEETNGRGE